MLQFPNLFVYSLLLQATSNLVLTVYSLCFQQLGPCRLLEKVLLCKI
jgi:hypothetical protein